MDNAGIWDFCGYEHVIARSKEEADAYLSKDLGLDSYRETLILDDWETDVRRVADDSELTLQIDPADEPAADEDVSAEGLTRERYAEARAKGELISQTKTAAEWVRLHIEHRCKDGFRPWLWGSME